MVIEISHEIRLRGDALPPPILKRIKQELTLTNPEYQQAIKFGQSPYTDKPKFIELFRTEDLLLCLPRGYGGKLIKILQEYNVRYTIQDKRVTLAPVQFKSSIKLRDYQQHAVNEMLRSSMGGIVAPCGAGKTIMILSAIERIQQPTLVVVHTKELADQFIDRACAVFEDMERDEIGVIGDGQFRIGKRLTVALIQTLSKTEEDLTEKFGAVFVDEAHHLAARSFFYPIGNFKAKIRYWVSATPDRADGLTGMVFAAAGPILHTIHQHEVPTVVPQLKLLETSYYSEETDYVRIISDLIKDGERNAFIVNHIAEEARGNHCLVLSERIEHLETLKIMLQMKLPDLTIEVLTGSLKKKERTDIMQRVKNKEVDILLATQLAREGLDVPYLNRLFLTVPKKSQASVQQEVGRIMRPYPGKETAIVFDFWDSRNPILKSQFWTRREVYKKIGMISHNWKPERKAR